MNQPPPWKLYKAYADGLIGLGPVQDQGRTATSLRTDVTPRTPRAMVSALLRSNVLLAKPESITVPFSVSTLMEEPALQKSVTSPRW